MTKLNKSVVRLSELSIVRDGGRTKPLVITIYPSGVVGIRPHKTRREEFITLTACYDLAVKLRVRATKQEKAKVKRATK